MLQGWVEWKDSRQGCEVSSPCSIPCLRASHQSILPLLGVYRRVSTTAWDGFCHGRWADGSGIRYGAGIIALVCRDDSSVETITTAGLHRHHTVRLSSYMGHLTAVTIMEMRMPLLLSTSLDHLQPYRIQSSWFMLAG